MTGKRAFLIKNRKLKFLRLKWFHCDFSYSMKPSKTPKWISEMCIVTLVWT